MLLPFQRLHHSPPLLVISDRSQARRPLVEIAEAAFRGGCRWFSLREKDLGAAERRDLLRALVMLGRGFGATVTAHEDIASAIAAEQPEAKDTPKAEQPKPEIPKPNQAKVDNFQVAKSTPGLLKFATPPQA